MEKTLTDERILYSICTSDELLADFLKEIARRLKEERLRQDMDVATLSELSSINNSIIYRYEKGTNQVSLQVLIKIASALKLDIAKMIPINTSQKEETVGEKFSYIVRGQSKESIEVILKAIENVIGFCEAERRIKYQEEEKIKETK